MLTDTDTAALTSRRWQRDRHGWHPPGDAFALLCALGERVPVPDNRVLAVRDAMAEAIQDMRRIGFVATRNGEWFLPEPWKQYEPLSLEGAVRCYFNFYRSGLLACEA